MRGLGAKGPQKLFLGLLQVRYRPSKTPTFNVLLELQALILPQ